MASANNIVFEAGSNYKGQQHVVLENGFDSTWQCNGSVCKTSGNWPRQLSQESCRNLVAKVGEIDFFKSSEGKIWAKGSAELEACNKTPRNITWSAGSSYRGTIVIEHTSRPNMKWYCDGRACKMSAPWSNYLTLDVCQKLVEKVGKVAYYRNSAGKSWEINSQDLAQCNSTPRKMNYINAFG